MTTPVKKFTLIDYDYAVDFTDEELKIIKQESLLEIGRLRGQRLVACKDFEYETMTKIPDRKELDPCGDAEKWLNTCAYLRDLSKALTPQQNAKEDEGVARIIADSKQRPRSDYYFTLPGLTLEGVCTEKDPVFDSLKAMSERKKPGWLGERELLYKDEINQELLGSYWTKVQQHLWKQWHAEIRNVIEAHKSYYYRNESRCAEDRSKYNYGVQCKRDQKERQKREREEAELRKKRGW